MRIKYAIFILIIIIFWGLQSCKPPLDQIYKTIDQFLDDEQEFKDNYKSSKISVTGKIIDMSGNPISGAAVSIADQNTLTNFEGNFSFSSVSRVNCLLIVSAYGYSKEILPVYFNIPKSQTLVTLSPILLYKNEADSVRFLFSGDTSFARRFLDPSDTTPRNQIPIDHPDALIKASDPLPGSQAVMQWMRPYYQDADFGVLNFESPVLIDPSTPHWEKDYAYFTLPGSLPALKYLGVDYVSLGNNHIYDYLSAGLISTLDNLDKVNIPYSGAGLTINESFLAHRTVLKNSSYALLSMTSISGRKHRISYVADEIKGGAADLTRRKDVLSAIKRESSQGFIPILQLHGGTEYSYFPTEYIRGSMELLSNNGAALIISHHSHVAQGVDRINGIITLLGLGNFAFDQDRLETMMGLTARIEMTGREVKDVRLIPVYLEDYRPKPVSGRLVNLTLRRLSEFSGKNVKIYPYNNQGWVEWEPYSYQKIERKVVIDTIIPDSGFSIVDLRSYAKFEESLSVFSSNSTKLKVRIGRDIMVHGDFEDWDSDRDTFEVSRWDISGDSVGVSLTQVYNGTAAVYSTRSTLNIVDSVIPFRNRLRVWGDELDKPNKDLSFLGYIKGESAGPISIIARFHASTKEKEFGEEEIYSNIGGTFDWQAIAVDIHMPADDLSMLDNTIDNPRALRIFLHHSPPSQTGGVAFYDEIAVINWEETLLNNELLITPHARDFLRVEAVPGNNVRLTCTFTSYLPMKVK